MAGEHGAAARAECVPELVVNGDEWLTLLELMMKRATLTGDEHERAGEVVEAGRRFLEQVRQTLLEADSLDLREGLTLIQGGAE